MGTGFGPSRGRGLSPHSTHPRGGRSNFGSPVKGNALEVAQRIVNPSQVFKGLNMQGLRESCDSSVTVIERE